MAFNICKVFLYSSSNFSKSDEPVTPNKKSRMRVSRFSSPSPLPSLPLPSLLFPSSSSTPKVFRAFGRTLGEAPARIPAPAPGPQIPALPALSVLPVLPPLPVNSPLSVLPSIKAEKVLGEEIFP